MRSLGGKHVQQLWYDAGGILTSLADHIVTFTREGNVGYGCQVSGTDVDVR